MVSSLHASVCFIGTNGIDSQVGFTTPDIDEAEVKRVMIQNSQESIVMADHTKFSQIYTSSFASNVIVVIMLEPLRFRRLEGSQFGREERLHQ